MSSANPESFNPIESLDTDFGKAQRLYEISGDASQMLLDFLQKHPELNQQTRGQIGALSSKIAGMVYSRGCDLLGIPETVRHEIVSPGYEGGEDNEKR